MTRAGSEIDRVIEHAMSPFGWMTPGERATIAEEIRLHLLPTNGCFARAVRVAQQLAAQWQRQGVPIHTRARRLIAASMTRVAHTSALPSARLKAWQPVADTIPLTRSTTTEARAERLRGLVIALRYGSRNLSLGAIAAFLELTEAEAQKLHDDGLDTLYDTLALNGEHSMGINDTLNAPG